MLSKERNTLKITLRNKLMPSDRSPLSRVKLIGGIFYRREDTQSLHDCRNSNTIQDSH